MSWYDDNISYDECRQQRLEEEQSYREKERIKEKRRNKQGAVLKSHNKDFWEWTCSNCSRKNYLIKSQINQHIRETIYCSYCGSEEPLIETEEILNKRQQYIHSQNKGAGI